MEEYLNTTGRCTITKANCLAQLLLLLKVMDLELAILAVSWSTLMMHSRTIYMSTLVDAEQLWNLLQHSSSCEVLPVYSFSWSTESTFSKISSSSTTFKKLGLGQLIENAVSDAIPFLNQCCLSFDQIIRRRVRWNPFLEAPRITSHCVKSSLYLTDRFQCSTRLSHICLLSSLHPTFLQTCWLS